MTIAIIGAGTARNTDLASLRLRPEFRKATLNMILASASQDQAFAHLSPLLSDDILESSAMILGSSYGELGTTISFLDFLSQSGVARPLLFQNSLHNSTLGFLAMRLRLKGPAITLSNSTNTGEDCLDLAATLLGEKNTLLCSVTAVDSIVTQLKIDDEENIGSKGEGAGTLVLSRKEEAEKRAWPVLAYLKTQGRDHRLPTSAQALGGASMVLPSSYHSDSIEHLALQLQSGTKPSSLLFAKNDASHSFVELEWP